MQTPIAILVLLFSLSFHEFAHARAALRLGDDTAQRLGRVSLNPLAHIDPVGTIIVPLVMALLPGGMIFGWAKPVPVDERRLGSPLRDQALIAAAGPVSNLLLAAVFAIGLGLTLAGGHGGPLATLAGGDVGVFLRLLCQWGISLNVLLALFNMIPLPPLDGSWIMRLALRGDARAAYERLRPYGFLMVLALMYVGLGSMLGRGVAVVGSWYLQVALAVGNLLT